MSVAATTPAVQRRKFIDITAQRGLLTGLKCMIDVGDSATYNGSGTRLTDLSGIGSHFDFGPAAAAPAYNGTPGGLAIGNYMSFDGGDYLQHFAANPAWINALHVDNAKWRAAFYIRTNTGGVVQRFFGTDGAVNTNIGISGLFSAGNALQMQVRGGTLGLTQASTLTTSLGAWEFWSIGMDEAAGAGGLTYAKNATADSDDATITSPSAAAATFVMQVGAGGNAVNPVPSGFRLGAMWWWQGAGTPNPAQTQALFQATKSRYSL